jgi:hypothetical protein
MGIITLPYLVHFLYLVTVLCYVCQTDGDGRKQTTDESNQSILPKQAYSTVIYRGVPASVGATI